MGGETKKRGGEVDEKGFFLQYWGISKKGRSMTPIFLVAGKEGGGGRQEEGRKGREGNEGRGGEGEKKGFFFGRKGWEEGERGGRRLKMVMDIEVGERDDGEEREQEEGGEIKKRIRGSKKGVG